MNLVDFQWADVVADPQLGTSMDLQNAITHEMGHFLGLDHTCYNPLSPGTTGRPIDSTGTPVPDCDVATRDVQDTTMYPSAMPGDTQKRTLAPDDRAGVCGIYPVGDAPPDGVIRGGCGACAVGDGGPTSAAAGALAGGAGRGGVPPAEARLMARRAAACGALLAVLTAPAVSRAYVRAHAAQSLLPTFWDAGCQIVTIYPNGFTEMTSDEVAKSIAAAAHAWSPDAVTCPAATGDGGAGAGHPSFEIITQIATGPAPSKGPGWNQRGHLPDGRLAGSLRRRDRRDVAQHGPFGTDLRRRHRGERGASREMFPWGNIDPSAPTNETRIDLQTAMTHEFGHFLGLAHTCYHAGVGSRPLAQRRPR